MNDDVKDERRVTGRVARLPVAARNVVNHGLREGRLYREIVAELAERGYPGLGVWSVARWRKSGFRQWLAEQEAFERGQRWSEETRALLGQLREGGECVMADLGEAIVAQRLRELLESREGGEEEFLKVARVFTGFMAARAQRQRVELERGGKKLKIKNAKLRKKGMSQKESEEMKERIKLM